VNLQLKSARPAVEQDAGAGGLDLRVVAQVAVIGIFLLLLIAFLDLARIVLLPVVAAVIVGTALDPLSRRAERARIPRVLFAIGVIAVLLAVAYLGLLVLSEPIIEAAKDAPRIGAAIMTRLQEIRDNVGAIRYLLSLMGNGEARWTIDLANYVKPVLGFLTPTLGQLVIFFATLFLFLLDQAMLRQKLILVFPDRDARLQAVYVLNEINDGLIRYIGAVTIINLGVGVITGLGLYLLQFPNPLFWGAAVFIANFVPFIGPTAIVIALAIGGLISFPTVSEALLAPAFFIALSTIEGQLVTPNVIGHNFKISALAVFLSLAFWAWLWGPVGAFLSLPLLIVVSTVLRRFLPAKNLKLPD
jgi:predicted PurR-regulated permease PerM